MAFTLGAAQLTALFMETLFYGLFLATFFQTTRTLLFTRAQWRRGDVRWSLVLVSWGMFLIGTLDVVLLFKHNLDGFVNYTGPGGPDARFGDISDWVNPTRAVTFCLQVVLGDGMLIYRCFIVYSRSWLVIVVPCLLCIGTAACGLAVPVVEANFKGDAALTAKKLNVWTDAGTVLTLCTNLSTTCLIAARLYMVSRRSTSLTSRTTHVSGGHPVRYAMRIIVESGVIYIVCTIILATVSYSDSLSVYAVSDSLLQIIGVSFNLIIIRVSNNTTIESQYGTQANTKSNDQRSYPLRFVTGTDSRRSGLGSSTQIGTSAVATTSVKERGVEFVQGDEESQKGGYSEM
ncbi:hypothetical protein PUNSTDRAFT_136326 [Punctularia strigosozonata HHB-11173 SS5]|uniref:uncharacterized protein n=1 Tax=Punctularia strigosozonata (strain HHB-11173) TaxID=741275 RepID=UPI0004416709|nr:uncharacterized protein PUNSTDRAFT_136326 [Punctularia strigosozonata HHB-11173 SS5]EIN06466.1 hypothetical protein PUNSTDRAFT_136326 [Punctularia strigosozonata HHB-11173 SS5]